MIAWKAVKVFFFFFSKSFPHLNGLLSPKNEQFKKKNKNVKKLSTAYQTCPATLYLLDILNNCILWYHVNNRKGINVILNCGNLNISRAFSYTFLKKFWIHTVCMQRKSIKNLALGTAKCVSQIQFLSLKCFSPGAYNKWGFGEQAVTFVNDSLL